MTKKEKELSIFNLDLNKITTTEFNNFSKIIKNNFKLSKSSYNILHLEDTINVSLYRSEEMFESVEDYYDNIIFSNNYMRCSFLINKSMIE